MSVREVKKRPGHMLVTFEDGKTLRVPFALYRERRIEAGAPVTYDACAAWLQSRETPHALERAVKFLSLRERSVRETRECLTNAGYSEDCAARVVALLQERKLLSDERFAGLWVDARAGKLGARRIEQELRQKGVDRQTAQDALELVDEDEQLVSAIALAKKALSRTTGKTPPQARAFQALMRRGYDASVAKKAIAAALNSDELDDILGD